MNERWIVKDMFLITQVVALVGTYQVYTKSPLLILSDFIGTGIQLEELKIQNANCGKNERMYW